MKEASRVDGIRRWRCLCKCGNQIIVRQGNLLYATKSCGCLRRRKKAMVTKAKRLHGGGKAFIFPNSKASLIPSGPLSPRQTLALDVPEVAGIEKRARALAGNGNGDQGEVLTTSLLVGLAHFEREAAPVAIEDEPDLADRDTRPNRNEWLTSLGVGR